MTIEELILWIDRAIEVREKSWKESNTFLVSGEYKINNTEALKAATTEEPKSYELDIASVLMPWSNDITDWKKQIEKT